MVEGPAAPGPGLEDVPPHSIRQRPQVAELLQGRQHELALQIIIVSWVPTGVRCRTTHLPRNQLILQGMQRIV